MTDNIRTIEIRYKNTIREPQVPESFPEKFVELAIERFIDLFTDKNLAFDIDNIEFIWCIVGNVIDKHYVGKNKEIKRGTKQFSPGTKVYCFPPFWGDGYENVIVIGKPRYKRRNIKVVMQSKFIKNWRMKKVFEPEIISEMIRGFGWTHRLEDKEEIERFLETFPKVNELELPLSDEEKEFDARNENQHRPAGL